jgi:hypothetical protein
LIPTDLQKCIVAEAVIAHYSMRTTPRLCWYNYQKSVCNYLYLTINDHRNLIASRRSSTYLSFFRAFLRLLYFHIKLNRAVEHFISSKTKHLLLQHITYTTISTRNKLHIRTRRFQHSTQLINNIYARCTQNLKSLF